MTVSVLTGLPGSGKSTHLICRVNERLAQGRPVATFACADSPRLMSDKHVADARVLGSRRPDVSCPLDHLTTVEESGRILTTLEPGTLVAFEEGHYFGPDIVPLWVDAADRGLEVLVAMPSQPQLHLLRGYPYQDISLDMACQRCAARSASTFLLFADEERTTSICDPCADVLTSAARSEIVRLLQEEDPYPGERAVYQPVELEECEGWRVLRPDSYTRADVMVAVLDRLGLVVERGPDRHTYLDVGCNTGFFCSALANRGFFSHGVDVTRGSIDVARLLSTYVRRDKTRYEVAEGYEYLRATQGQRFDVTSAFSVHQWVMLQRSVADALVSMEWLFAKTGKVCFFETGYSSEAHLQAMKDSGIDRAWVLAEMRRSGDFAEIEVLDATEHGLMRDLFVGITARA